MASAADLARDSVVSHADKDVVEAQQSVNYILDAKRC
ncbi:hypothetical protein SAMN05216228_1010172 [Rhizobium tibeticum]|uniref:Uncharacterized protein n=1 Tax=Rhizobium tibeticum TaxID=501024 RepID=A0A1H8LAB2_9HYPH|nr:hypothetical protein RTCCBAU85039_2814 [Rhizobium tibeticum]SEO01726.1 hypothetical protein SAMN05216228_1010172 [Rhizobium tibeticum]